MCMPSSQGYVYILQSQNCDCVKIGGTDYPPLKRIKEINATEPYKSLGTWTLADFRQVTDWRTVEHNLHYRFRSALNTSIKNQRIEHQHIQLRSAVLSERAERDFVASDIQREVPTAVR